MTIEHRKAEIVAQVLNRNLTDLIGNLATALEANEILTAKVADQEKELASLKAPQTASVAP